jgi:hypothetical protein
MRAKSALRKSMSRRSHTMLPPVRLTLKRRLVTQSKEEMAAQTQEPEATDVFRKPQSAYLAARC